MIKSLLRRIVRRRQPPTPRDEMVALRRRGRPANPSAGPVLFWVPGGMSLMLHVEGAIAAALELRGVPVHAVICDGLFRACVKREVKDGIAVEQWADACADCRHGTRRVLNDMAIPHSFIGDLVSPAQQAELWARTEGVTWDSLTDLSHNGVALGNNARSAIVRYLQGKELAGHEEIVREYAYSTLVTAAAAAAACDRFKPSRIYMSHGGYAEWGPALHVGLARKIPVTAWMASYLRCRFYFRHVPDAVHIDFHNVSDAAWQACVQSPLTDRQTDRLNTFLEDRYHRHVSFDMKKFMNFAGDVERLRNDWITDSTKPTWGVMAHINWDAVCDYSPMAYESFDAWMVDTVLTLQEIPEVNWLIKVHPAEAWDNPASGVQRLVEQRFPNLPAHIRVVPAEVEISPLDFFQMVDGAVTVYGTSGLEMAIHGKPVILAGEAHYGGKGFTHDGPTRDAYRALLRRAASIGPLSAEQTSLACRYAYCYFIERQIPLPPVDDPSTKWWLFRHDRREQLLPGGDPFVDFICDRVLDGKDFIMDEALVAAAEQGAVAS